MYLRIGVSTGNAVILKLLLTGTPDARSPLSDNFNGSAQLRIQRKRLSQFQHLLANTRQRLCVLMILEGFNDPGAGLDHLFLSHAARGECLRTNADSTGLNRGIGIEK